MIWNDQCLETEEIWNKTKRKSTLVQQVERGLNDPKMCVLDDQHRERLEKIVRGRIVLSINWNEDSTFNVIVLVVSLYPFASPKAIYDYEKLR